MNISQHISTSNLYNLFPTLPSSSHPLHHCDNWQFVINEFEYRKQIQCGPILFRIRRSGVPGIDPMSKGMCYWMLADGGNWQDGWL